MKLFIWAAALAAATISLPAAAQTATSVQAPAGFAPLQAPCVKQADGSCPPVSSSLSFPVDIVVRAAAIDRGQVIGTTAVTIAPANPVRRGFAMQVQASASVSCYVNGNATATADYHSLQVGGGGFYQSPDGHVGTGALSVVCSVASTSVFFREW